MDEQMEKVQLLARFKLQVRRSLGEAVDLEALTRDTGYARRRLQEIEEAAVDEDLLVMVLRLRDLLLPVQPAAGGQAVGEESPPAVPATAASPTRETRTYLLGARSW